MLFTPREINCAPFVEAPPFRWRAPLSARVGVEMNVRKMQIGERVVEALEKCELLGRSERSIEDVHRVFANDLWGEISSAREAGPLTVDPEVVAFIEALDPTALTDADFDGLLAASGLVGGDAGGLAVPERMAEVNALLDVAAPAMREALLVAFLDRLSRPNRG